MWGEDPFPTAKSPPKGQALSPPPVGQTLGSSDPPEGRALVTNAPCKKTYGRHFGAKHRRPEGRTATERPWHRFYDAKQPKLIKIKCTLLWNKNRKERHKQKILLFFTAEFSHFLSQNFWHFVAKNCDQKVTKFISEKNLPVGEKKEPPPLTVGQTLGSSHFRKHPCPLGTLLYT